MRSKFALIYILLVLLLPAKGMAAIIDRMVAFVDDQAILLSQLDQAYEKAKALAPDITKEEVLQTLINRRLLLIDATKLFPDVTDEDKVLKEYIDLRVRAFIIIPEDEIEAFYEQNKTEFKGAPYEDVREQIETLLREKEVNEKLESLIDNLRANAHIRTFLYDSEIPSPPESLR
jgi:hypothetical protein